MHKYIIDANIIIRMLAQDNLEMALKSRQIFSEIEKNNAIGIIHTVAIHEILYVLNKYYGISRQLVGNELVKTILIPNIQVYKQSKDMLLRVINQYMQSCFDFPDILYAEISKNENYDILSFDRDFDKIGVRRYETIN